MQKPHHEILSGFSRHLKQGRNPADVLHELKFASPVAAATLAPLLYQILVRDRSYSYLSFNLQQTAPHWRDLWELAMARQGFDTVIAGYRSERELLLINPLVEIHWKKSLPLQPDSLMVVYTRCLPERNRVAEEEFLVLFRSACENPPTVTETEESMTELPPPLRKTPRYAVPVTNEFFHYGNVEAWQNIIEHYQEKHPNSKIYVFHHDKPVHRISTLYKWGRVSVGDVIHFMVTGADFENVAKLKKYLKIGASPKYLIFIKKHLNDTLNLF